MSSITKKFLSLGGLILSISILTAYFWQRDTPKKPDEIPLGDYSYTLEFAQHNVEKLMKQHHLPSGSFAGETMLYDPETGNITHQMIVYIPK